MNEVIYVLLICFASIALLLCSMIINIIQLKKQEKLLIPITASSLTKTKSEIGDIESCVTKDIPGHAALRPARDDVLIDSAMKLSIKSDESKI